MSAQPDQTVDIEAVMRTIKDRVRQDLKALPASRVAAPVRPSRSQPVDTSTPLFQNQELHFLNLNWAGWAQPESIQSHRKFVGGFIGRLKRWVVNVVYTHLFGSYFKREQEYQSNLVRYLNHQARYTDARLGEIFRQINQKFDNDLVAMNDRVDRLFDYLGSNQVTLDEKVRRELTELRGELSELQRRPGRNEPQA